MAPVSSIKFDCSGKFIAVGNISGSVCVINIENGDVYDIYDPIEVISSPIRQISWRKIDMVSPKALQDELRFEYRSSLDRGGVNLVDRIGFVPLPDISGSEKDVSNKHCKLIESCGNQVLLICTDVNIHGFLYGIFPLFTVDLNSLGGNRSGYIEGLFNNREGRLISSSLIDQDLVISCVSNVWLSNLHLCWVQHCIVQLFFMSDELTQVHNIIAACGKKWQEACRVILPKLKLFQTSLTNYDLSFTVVDAFFLTCLAGQWHSVVTSAIQSQWNEQGLGRLESSLEGAATWIVKSLLCRAMPLLSNILLRSQELLGIVDMIFLSAASESLGSSSISLAKSLRLSIMHFLMAAQKFMFKMDDAIFEARKARERMQLFVDVSYCCYFI